MSPGGVAARGGVVATISPGSFARSLDSGASFGPQVPLEPTARAVAVVSGRGSVAVSRGDGSFVHVWDEDLNRTPPDTVIVRKPPRVTNLSSATFAFESVPEGAGFECSINDAPFTSCASPLTLEDLSEGRRLFRVRARDADGYVDPTSASWMWTVDLTPPEFEITSAPSGRVGSSEADITFAGAEPLGYTCALDGRVPAPCVSPYELRGLGEGPHDAVVTAADAAGNTSSRSARWIVDLSPPAVTLVAAPPAYTSSTSAVVEFDVDDADALLACALDGTALPGCRSPVRLESLSEGPHRLLLRATDVFGRVGELPVTWHVDRSSPHVQLTWPRRGAVTCSARRSTRPGMPRSWSLPRRSCCGRRRPTTSVWRW